MQAMNSKFLYLFAASLFFGLSASKPAHGQGDATLEACIAIQDSEERLACFDQLTENNDVTADASAEEDVASSPWHVEDQLDDLYGRIVHARNTSIRVQSDRTAQVTINVRCLNGRVEGFFNWGTAIAGNDGWNDVTYVLHNYRLDDHPVVKVTDWSTSTTKTATFFTHGKDNLAVRLMSASELVVSISPSGANSITATFDVAGGNDAIGRVLAACGVEPEQVGKDGMWGIESQKVESGNSPGATPTEAGNSTATPLQTSFQPENAWQYRQSGPVGEAFVLSKSQQSELVVFCNANTTSPWLILRAPENWTANADVQVQVDDAVFAVVIDGGDGVILSDLPDIGITAGLLTALKTGTLVGLTGPATQKMDDGARVFSLRGSSAAIAKMEQHCG